MNNAIIGFGPGFGGDGGFWVLGADGKLHWVPPWNPEVTKQLGVATSLAAVAQQITDVAIRDKIVGLAEGLVANLGKSVQTHVRAING